MLFPGWETEIVTNKNDIRESGKSFSVFFFFGLRYALVVFCWLCCTISILGDFCSEYS